MSNDTSSPRDKSTIRERHTHTELVSPEDALTVIAYSFFDGMQRLQAARAGHLTVWLGLVQINSIENIRDKIPPVAVDAFNELLSVTFREFDSHDYIARISHLVYATSLFDTFLSDLLRLLYILQPLAMGPDSQISLTEVLSSQSKEELLNKRISKCTLEQSRQSFISRIKFIEKTFGLQLRTEKAILLAIKECSDVRHSTIHDQGIFSFELIGQNSNPENIRIRQKTCVKHPTDVSHELVRKAMRTYSAMANIMSRQTMKKLIKSDGSELFNKITASIWGGEPDAHIPARQGKPAEQKEGAPT